MWLVEVCSSVKLATNGHLQLSAPSVVGCALACEVCSVVSVVVGRV